MSKHRTNQAYSNCSDTAQHVHIINMSLYALTSQCVITAMTDKILDDCVGYQAEATEICLSKLNSVVEAEAREAYDIRYTGNW